MRNDQKISINKPVVTSSWEIGGAGKMFSIFFEMNELPLTINKNLNRHWGKRNRDNKRWDAYVRAITSGHRPKTPLKRARLVLTRYSSKCPDYDGLCSTWKGVIDALVTCGVLEDDSFTHIGMPEMRWEHRPQGKGKIRVEVYSSDGASVPENK